MNASIMAIDSLLETPARPLQDRAPPASAPFSAREAWCQSYSSLVVSELYDAVGAAAEARPTQPFETELNSCKLDPEAYERQTRAEASQTARTR